MKSPVTDREVYPALLITLAALGGGYLLWRYTLHRPTIASCWIYTHWHIYCPACGGTRSLIALSQGNWLRSFYYNPAVPYTILSAAPYLISQMVWRLRGKRGWVLHYSSWWFWSLLLLMAVNCAVRNILLLAFHHPM